MLCSHAAVPFTCLALFAAATTATAQERSPFWMDLQPGPYAVGFSAEYLLDTSRAFWPADSAGKSEIGRPVRIYAWYPAPNTTDTAMTFRNYLEVRPTEELFEYYNRVIRGMEQGTATRQFSPASDSLLNVIAALRTAARRDVPPAPGRFPLVVHSLGSGNYQLESTVMWEYLASHGYVVVTVPQLGASPWQGVSFDAASLETQYGDVAFAAAFMGSKAYVDASRLAVTGHSAGGMVTALMAARHPEVRATVGLDASYLTGDGSPLLHSMDWAAEDVRVPLLTISRRRAEGLDRRSLEGMYNAARYHVTLGGPAPPEMVTHFDFQNWPLYAGLVQQDDPRGASARPAAFGAEAYLLSSRMTLRFLHEVLGGRNPSIETIVGTDSGRVSVAFEFLPPNR